MSVKVGRRGWEREVQTIGEESLLESISFLEARLDGQFLGQEWCGGQDLTPRCRKHRALDISLIRDTPML